ncbi:MAG: TfoX/Sxy family protein [Clostridia bacterium]|nr:TfoX/Sxy family protein [Clostridia bacterium]
MSSSKEYLEFILQQLSDLDEIEYRYMMGEYILYYKGKIFGGIYDDRFLIKPVKSAIDFMPNAKYEIPYKNGKEMLLIDDVDDKERLAKLIKIMYDELPARKLKKKK